MRYGSLFTGVGLMDLGVEMAARDAGVSLECAWQVEINPFCRAVLAKHWPGVARHDDVTKVGADLSPVDLIVGGFPCQDVSVAGAGAGLAGERSGLWFEYLRIIHELAPRAVIIENVPGLIRRGLDVVVAGLTDAGYAVEATRIQASDLGAPHRRERIFIVGMAHAERGELREQSRRQRGARGAGAALAGEACDVAGDVGNAHGAGREGAPSRRLEAGGSDALQRPGHHVTCGAEPGVGRVPDGRAPWLDGHRWPAPPGEQYEWEPPRTEEGVANRPARLKALGNGNVPQCAYVAARRALQHMVAA